MPQKIREIKIVRDRSNSRILLSQETIISILQEDLIDELTLLNSSSSIDYIKDLISRIKDIE